ncbi:MAG TPA: PTS sugar transporter subunit IIB [Candidatus Saccharimonadales bacterium]|nr:PTS sugar transporter subunit IIB [Candidatus Saccharimonadales bacterium]
MGWALVRLDDRLLHGQVAIGWAGRLRPRRIVVADDELSASELGRELAEASAPPGVEVRVVALDEVAGLAPGTEDGAFLLLRGPHELQRLVRAGVRPAEVNVGGLHAAPGRRRVLDYLYLDAGEVEALRAAAAAGCRLRAQDVPGNPELDVLPLLSKAGL